MCDETSINGHNWCILSNNVVVSTSPEISEIKDGYSNVIVKTQYAGGLYSEATVQNIPNTPIILPKTKVTTDDKSTVIIGIEFGIKNDNTIDEISGIYYISLKNIITQKDIKCYADTINPYFNDPTSGKELIRELYRNDISDSSGNPLGMSTTNKKLILAPPGSALYSYSFFTNGITNVSAAVLTFRDITNNNIKTVLLNNGIIINNPTNLPLLGNYGYNAPSYSYIQSVNLAYNNYTPENVSNFLSFFFDVDITPILTTFGFKGIINSTYITYNNEIIDWISNINPIKCCQLIEDEQYADETIEKDVCIYKLDYITRSDFPVIIPNQTCRDLLQSNLTKDNIDTDLYEKFCTLKDSNCDNSIIDYCNEKYKKTIGTKQYLDFSSMYKDQICACYSDSEGISDPSKSAKLANDTFIDYKIKPEYKDSLPTPYRFECTNPGCKSTNYKLKSMKDSIDNTPCTDNEKCFGDGFYFPYYNKDSIRCKTFENDNTCLSPYIPNTVFFPNPIDQNCSDKLIDEDPIKYKVKSCKLDYTSYDCQQCINGFKQCKPSVLVDGYPETNCKRNMILQACETTPNMSKFIYLGIGILIVIVTILFLIRKFLNKKR